ncbi:hypothetical protein L7F22_025501 [Adiantum nelumboides]|nr:hypothetical protein [Adiantum nelumboides]
MTGSKLDTILSLDHRMVPNTTDEATTMEVMPFLEVEEPWPQSLWETIRNRKDGSATLQSAPILEVVLNNEFHPDNIQSLYGDAGTEIFVDMVDFGKTNNFDIILGQPFMRQLKMIQDWGYEQIYLRHKELVTKINMKNHSYRDVAKTPVQEFDSTTVNGKEVPAWMQTKAHVWMCGASDSGDLTKEECILERSVTDEAYIPEPFPEHLFEPFGWTQILSTLDICVNELTPTKFCDEEGYHLVTLQMASAILKSGSESDENEKLTRKVECKRIVDEISVIDIEKQLEDKFMDSLSEDHPLLDEDFPIIEADDERSSESESERKNTPQPKKFYDFLNQEPRRQERYRQRRSRRSKGKRNKPMPLVKDKMAPLGFIFFLMEGPNAFAIALSIAFPISLSSDKGSSSDGGSRIRGPWNLVLLIEGNTGGESSSSTLMAIVVQKGVLCRLDMATKGEKCKDALVWYAQE